MALAPDRSGRTVMLWVARCGAITLSAGPPGILCNSLHVR